MCPPRTSARLDSTRFDLIIESRRASSRGWHPRSGVQYIRLILDPACLPAGRDIFTALPPKADRDGTGIGLTAVYIA